MSKNKIAYIFYEGDTEEVFYKRIFSQYLREVPKKTKNLETGTGINANIAREIYYFLNKKENKNVELYVYVFIDREGTRSDLVEFDADAIKRKLNKKQIKRIAKIEAVQMIESWFFYDLESICDYIGLPLTESLSRNYSNPERLTHRDLSKLFQKGIKKKHYRKGDEAFLNKLNIEKIYNNCNDLREGIEMIRKDFGLS